MPFRRVNAAHELSSIQQTEKDPLISLQSSIKKAIPSFVEEHDESEKQAEVALKAFNRASQLMSQKHYTEAIEQFDKAIEATKLYKDFLEIRTKSTFMRGQTYMIVGDKTAAIDDYIEAISLAQLLKEQQPEVTIKLSNYYVALGNLLNHDDQFERAVEEYSEGINWLEKDSADLLTCTAAYYNRGMAFLSLERLDEAREDFQKAIDFINEDPTGNKQILIDSYYHLARCYHLANDSNKALECYNIIVTEIDPDHILSNFHRARILYYDENDFRGAIRSFDRVLAANTTDDSSYYNRGMAYKFLEEWDKAVHDFKSAVECNDKFMKAYVELARSTVNRDGEATDDNDILLYYDRALYLLENNKVEQNVPSLSRTEIAQLYFERGVLLNKQGRYHDAIKDYDKCCELDRLHEEAYFNRGVIFSRQLKQPEKAFKDFEHVLKFAEDVPTLTERAVLNISLNNFEAARTDLNRVLELEPDNEVGYGLLEYVLSL